MRETQSLTERRQTELLVICYKSIIIERKIQSSFQDVSDVLCNSCHADAFLRIHFSVLIAFNQLHDASGGVYD